MRAPVLSALLLVTGPALAAPTARFPETVAPEPRPAAVEKAKPPAREPWGRSAARERLRRALEHGGRGDTAQALADLYEATRFDPSFGEAYLALGKLREQTGDLAEAARVYDAASRLPSVRAEALYGRARVAKSLGHDRDAFRDLEASVEIEPSRERLELLAEWYVARRAWPAALVAWRRVLALLDGEPGAARELARLRVRALVLLAADADPVVAGAGHHGGWVRRSLAQMARAPR